MQAVPVPVVPVPSLSRCLILSVVLLGYLAGGPVAARPSAWEALQLDTTPCVPDETTLCLNRDRFEVKVAWEDFEGGQGVGHARPQTGDSGWFWFFDDENVELLIKVLDARTINHKFWVFYGALSNVAYTITVRDTETGEVRLYPNPSRRFASVGDTAAFPLEEGEEAAEGAAVSATAGSLVPTSFRSTRPVVETTTAAGTCEPDATTLCLQDDRFRVRVEWEDFQGGEGEGQAVPLMREGSTEPADDSGFFWFFEPDNLELVVKVIDGRTVNGSFWLFYGALSNVEYRIEVVDVDSGRRAVFENPARRFGSFGDTETFDGSAFCGGIAGFPCLEGQLCDPDPGSCQVADVGGTCRERPGLCPAVFDPVCGCDGRTYGNDCERLRAGVAKDHDGACPDDLCGGIAGIPCPEDQFCDFEPGTCRMPDAAGTCKDLPDACTDELAPVCGCDGETYSNDCERRTAGVPKLHDGACEGESCNSLIGFPCAEGQLCDPTPNTCNIADAGGVCTVRPDQCTADFVPVCGCDGVSYANDCERLRAGVGKDHDGMCAGQVCGTFVGIPCSQGDFCEFPVGSCEAADIPGLCEERPEACILLLAPVCGCDGVTYDNDCFRRSAGVSKDHDGPCV